MDTKRFIVAAAEGYTARHARYQDRDHLVVPVVGLVPGVVRAMNSKHGNEFVSAEVINIDPARWEGKPLYEGHPLRNGKAIVADIPELRAAKSFGVVRNAKAADSLTMEAWLDVERAGQLAPDLFARAEAGEPIEISVGVLVATEEAEGEHNGRQYAGRWTDYDPDHLALLPDGVLGACSRTMGCGVRAMQAADELPENFDAPDEVYMLYSEDQSRDERGMFAAAAQAHRDAAASHRYAQGQQSQAAVKDRNENSNKHYQAKAHDATLTAQRSTENAAKSSNAAIGTTHGDKARELARQANDHARNRQHGDARTMHKVAAEHHDQLAKLIEKAGEIHKQISNYSVDSMYLAWLEAGAETDTLLTTLRSIPQSVRDTMDKADFAGPNESFPIAEGVDVEDAAQALGRAKGDRAAIKRNIVRIAYRKGFEKHLPEDWQHRKNMEAATGFAKFMENARKLFKDAGVNVGYEAAQDVSEMSGGDLRSKLFDAVKDLEPTLVNVEDYFPVTDPSHVVYAVYDGSKFEYYERSFNLADSGVVTVADQKVPVVRITKWEPAEGASPSLLEQNRGVGSPEHSDNQPNEEETDMTKEEIVKALQDAKNLTPCQITALQAALEGKTTETPKVPTEAELKVLADARTAEVQSEVAKAFAALTFDQVLAKAPAGVRDLISTGVASGESIKAKTIKALMDTGRCGYSEDELKGMTQGNLNQLVTLAGDNVRAAIDFGANGGPANTDTKNPKEVAVVEDLGTRIRAAQAASKK